MASRQRRRDEWAGTAWEVEPSIDGKRNPEYYRRKARDATKECPGCATAKQRERKHGITQAAFEAQAAQQNNRCPICNKVFKGSKDMHLDHNHKTGQVRMILCRKCNLGIGMFDENIKRLQRVRTYLTYFNSLG